MLANLATIPKQLCHRTATYGRIKTSFDDSSCKDRISAQVNVLFKHCEEMYDCPVTSAPEQGSLSAEVYKLGARPFPASILQRVCREASLMHPRRQACWTPQQTAPCYDSQRLKQPMIPVCTHDCGCPSLRSFITIQRICKGVF